MDDETKILFTDTNGFIQVRDLKDMHAIIDFASLTAISTRTRAANDVYLCPAGEQLTYRYTSEEDGKTLRRYWTTACEACALKGQCTTGKERRISRWEYEAVLEAVQARLDRNVKPRRGRAPRHSILLRRRNRLESFTLDEQVPVIALWRRDPGFEGLLGLHCKSPTNAPSLSRV